MARALPHIAFLLVANVAACEPRDLRPIVACDTDCPPNPTAECEVRCEWPMTSCVRSVCQRSISVPTFAVGVGSACGVRGGTLLCWGDNSTGQLGLDDLVSRSVPTPVGSASDWRVVAGAGGLGHCGIRGGESLWCWGWNDEGSLGTGDTVQRRVPVEVGAGTSWAIPYPGHGHTCAIDRERSLWCWGRNADGELGLGDLESRLVPTRIDGLRVSLVAVGWGQTCAITAEGALWCWGRDPSAESTAATAPGPTRPTPVEGPSDWIQIDSAGRHFCGLRADQSLWCWGTNGDGNLGTGDVQARAIPTRVGLSRWTRVACGRYGTCGVDTDGALYCWGGWADGNDVPDASDQLTPELLAAGPGWTDVRVGMRFAIAARSDGALLGWGPNDVGQLGVGDTEARATPIPVEFP